MPVRSVYLGHIDIGPDAKLELRSQHADATDDEVLLYLFRYGLVADQVLMQGSAPLKSHKVLLSYLRLLEAFKRNENHEAIPVFAFVLSDEAEGYTEYILDRLHILRGTGNANAENAAYQMNNAIDAAKQLDAQLSMVNVPRRKRSVSKAFRNGQLALLRSNDPKNSGISLETSERAIEKVNDSEQIQTFKLISSLNLKEADQARALYQATRNRYRQANALGIGAMSSDDSPVWAPSHITRFLDAIGLQPWISDIRHLTAELLFKIRRIESYRALREEYFNAQSDADLVELTTMLRNLRLNGKVLSTVRQSPGALAALVFEGLNELKIGYKSLNKAGELITKTVFSDLADEHFAKRCYRLHSLVEQLERETSGLMPRSI